jgi:O-antigen/teichoic acid export membrane protein
MSDLKTLGKDTIIYGFGQVLKKAIGLFLLPFYTRALNPADYGILDSLGTLTFFLAIIFGLGLDGATSRYFFVAQDEKSKSIVLSTSLIIRVISSTVPIIFLIPLSSGISGIMFKESDYGWVVALTLINIPVQNISNLQENIFRYYRAPWKYMVISILRALITPVCGILLVVTLKLGVFGATLSNLVSSLIILFTAFFFYTRRKFIREFSWYWTKKLLKFGYPLIFTGILLWVNNVSDRFFLLHYSNLDQIGLYSIGNTFSQPILLINMALTMSFTVLAMSLFQEEKDDPDKPRTKAFFTRTWHLYLAFAGVCAVIISVFSYELVRYITTPEYISSILSIPFLLFSQILYQSTQLTGNGMTLMEKSKPYLWLMLIAAGTNFVLNFYFVPKFGFVGASITTIISNIVYFISAYFWSQKVFYIKRNLFKPIIFLIITFGISTFVPFAELEWKINVHFLYKIVMVIACLILPFIFKFISIQSLRKLSLKTFIQNK